MVVNQASLVVYIEVVPICAVLDDRHQLIDQLPGFGADVRIHKYFNHDFVCYLLVRFDLIEDVRERLDRLKYFPLSFRDRAWSTCNFVGWSLLYLHCR